MCQLSGVLIGRANLNIRHTGITLAFVGLPARLLSKLSSLNMYLTTLY